MSRRLTAALLIASYHHEMAMDNLADVEEREDETLAMEAAAEYGSDEWDYWEQYAQQRDDDAALDFCFVDDLPNFRDVSDDELSEVDPDWDELGGEAGAA